MNIVAHNLSAMNAQRQFGINTKCKAKSTEKLSSGYKINRAADDAAGLAISEKMRRQIRGLNQAAQNIQDGISLVQVADGALNETQEILQRMNELAVKAANGTNSSEDREYIQCEIDQLVEEVDRIANTTSFNEEIYPLKGGGLSADDLNGKIGLSYARFDNMRARNLDPFTYTNSRGQVLIDLKFKLNADTNSIQILTLDGSVIFDEECTNMVYQIQDRYERGDWRYQTHLSASNQYFYGTNGVSFGFWNSVPVTCDDVNNAFLENTAFTYWVCDDASMVIVGSYKVNDSNDSTKPDALGDLWIQMGTEPGQGMYIDLVDATANTLGVANVDVTTQDNAGAAISAIKNAINTVSKYRSNFGAQQNRLEHGYNVNLNTAENTTAAESRIRDTDMAKEMVKYSNLSILEQAGRAMMAQANQSNQGILSLLS